MAIHVVQLLTKTGITRNHEFIADSMHSHLMAPRKYAKVVQFSVHKEDGNMLDANCIQEILVC